MRAAVFALTLLAVSSEVFGAVCPASPAPSTTPTPSTTPWPHPSVNPAGLCPNAGCGGWGSGSATKNIGAALFSSTSGATTVSGPVKSVSYSDTTDVLKTTPINTVWPFTTGWQAGIYSMNYNAVNMCGATVTTKGTFDYRCNSPPVIVMNDTINVKIRNGAEVVLDAHYSYDLDASDKTSLTYSWCLLSTPSMANTGLTNVNNILRVPLMTNTNLNGVDVSGQPLEGYALLKPNHLGQGAYTVSLTVSDGCNYVSKSITVNVASSCCAHTANAGGASSALTWNQGEITSDVTTSTNLDWSATNTASCLPADYVLGSAKTGNPAFYKNLYSPVFPDGMGNTVTVDQYPNSFAPDQPGCTWPGASNFDPAATTDNGLCTCAPNVNSWSIPTSTGSFSRRVDPAGNTAFMTASTATTATVTFMTSLGSTLTMPEINCTRTVASTVSTITGTAGSDIRVITTKIASANPFQSIVSNPILPRPSTSWDATVAYNLNSNNTVWWNAKNVTTKTVASGNMLCKVELDGTNTATPTVTVTKGTSLAAGMNYKQCLGYYSFLLNSQSADVCPLSSDSVEIAVVCPYPPYVNILCDVSLLWDGTKFVANPGTPNAGLADGNWVQIDARQTTYASTNTYTMSIVNHPPPNVYPGANRAGIAPGPNPLEPYAAATDISVTGATEGIQFAAFLPSRGGVYEVALSADDGCNAPTTDSVMVSTKCLSMSVAPTAGSPDATFKSTITAAGATYGADRKNLNWAVRVVSRPLLNFGDIGPYTFVDPVTGVTVTSYECTLGPQWFTGTSTQFGTTAVPSNPTMEATLGLTGSYSFSVAVVDGCSKFEPQSPVSVNLAACPAASQVAPMSIDTTTMTAKWQGSTIKFGTVTLPLATGEPSTVTYTWFLTAAPVGGSTFKTYPATAPTSSSVTCSANSLTTGGLTALRQTTNPADAYAPIARTKALTFTPLAVSGTTQYGLTLQAIGVCDVKTVGTVPINAVCNSPARFVCLPTTGTTPAACTKFNQPSGVSSSTSTWNADLGRYSRVFVSALADGGADGDSATDTITYTFTLAATNPKSWWSVAYVTNTITWSFILPDTTANPATPGMFEDLIGFTTLTPLVNAAVLTALKASVPPTNSMDRAYVSDPALAYATAAAAGLGTTLTGGCFTPGLGRVFTAKTTFAILPPNYFRSAQPYAPDITANDFTPLDNFKTAFVAKAATIAATAASTASGTVPLAGLTVSADVTPAIGTTWGSTTNAYFQKVSVTMASGTASPVQTFSFLPDIDGTYTSAVTVVDDCPGAPNTTPVSWSTLNPSPSTSVSVAQIPCSTTLSGLSITQSVLSGGVAASISRPWGTRDTRFGDAWFYSAKGPAYPSATPLPVTPTTKCFGVDSTVSTTCFSGPSQQSVTFPSAAAGSALAAFALGLTSTNGGTVQITLSGPSSATNGAELRVGCSSANNNFPDLTAGITYFYTFATTATGQVYNLVLPSTCSGTGDIVFTQAATSASSVAWSISNLVIFAAPAGFGAIPPTTTLAYRFASSVGTLAIVAPPPSGTFVATDMNTPITFSSTGLAGNLPTSTATYTVSFSVSIAPASAAKFPAWAFTSVCSGSTTAANNVALTCPAYTAALGSNSPVAFNQTNQHFNPATVSWSVTPLTAVTYSDLRFGFNVASAPLGSQLNAFTLMKNYLEPLEKALNPDFWGTDTNGRPMNDLVETQCFTTAGSLALTVPVGSPAISYAYAANSNNVKYAANYIDVKSIKIALIAQSSVSPAWVADSTDNLQFPEYFLKTNGSASFIPDITSNGVSTGYTITATLDDGCNPVQTATAIVQAAACPPPAAVITTVSNPGITDAGAGRVVLSATVDSMMYLEDDMTNRIKSISWTVTNAAGVSIPVSDANSLYPSFVPPASGAYTATLSIDTGCQVFTFTQAVTVACTLTNVVTPVVNIAQGAQKMRIAQGTTLTLPFLPNAAGYTPDKIYWVGQPGCPVKSSSWDMSSMAYTCPTSTYAVSVASVFPSRILNTPATQNIIVTLKVGGVVGIPQGLQDLLYTQGGGPSSIVAKNYDVDSIKIMVGPTGNQKTCTNPYVLSFAAGQIICEISGLPVSTTSVVSVTLLGVASKDINADLVVPIDAAPMISSVSVVGSSAASTTGGTTIAIRGINLAFTPMFVNNFALPYTTVTISTLNGVDTVTRPCSNVQAVGGSMTTQPYLTCVVPAGYGTNINVMATVGFWDPLAFAMTQSSASAAGKFSYAAPAVDSAIVTSSTNGQGGYWATTTVRNLGSKYNTVDYLAPTPAPNALPIAPYSDLNLTLGSLPITKWYVTADETASNPAAIKFLVPAGCGTNLNLNIARGNAMSTLNTVHTFSYAAPVVKCIGQPFADATQGGCTRVFIEGMNLGSAANAILSTVQFMSVSGESHGYCDDIQFSADYVRVSCRLPSGAAADDVVVYTNECGQSSATTRRALSVSAGSGPSLPGSIQIAGCGNSFAVTPGQDFSYNVNAPLLPSNTSRSVDDTQVNVAVTLVTPAAADVPAAAAVGAKEMSWKDRQLSNGLFIGLVLPFVLVAVIGYPIYVIVSRRKVGGNTWANASGSSQAGSAGEKTVTKGATRVTMNPVSFAPAPPIKPADAPGAVHDNL